MPGARPPLRTRQDKKGRGSAVQRRHRLALALKVGATEKVVKAVESQLLHFFFFIMTHSLYVNSLIWIRKCHPVGI